MRFLSKILLFFALITTLVSAANWPRWRGPNDLGSTKEGRYPANLSDSKNLAWKLALPGKGCSTPVVWEKRIFITGPKEGQDTVSAITWNGEIAWHKSLGKERGGKHLNGSGSNPSCVTDGSLLFAYFKSGNFGALTFEGKMLWKKNLMSYGKDTLFWDFGTSPILTKKHVIMALMRKGNSWLVAFEKQTGKVAWQVERNYQTPIEGDHSYATPIVTTQNNREAILVWGAERFTAHDADNGDVLWTCSGFNPQDKKFWVVVSSFVVVNDMAIIPYGRGTRLAGIKLNGKGDITDTHRKWTLEGKGSFVPSPAAYNGKIYIVRDRGEVLCINPTDGEIKWAGAFPKNRASFYASPTIADGKIYAAREDGTLFVADIDNGFKLLTENNMGERIIASPVPVNSSLLIRGEKNFFCFRTN